MTSPAPIELRSPSMMAARCRATPLPCKCLDSASASAFLISTFLSASALSSMAFRRRLLVSISF
eukprot:CAMPEP_0204384550 /NCGR_PEP_ID=MMETSP0469-20131031/56966_1 /ASSEMBLY_ACC=CAM_ASM_000384 /TAXON_ID=2969 /ORGANISM="Oxyrrhis marina" /LENGTH=63 /DNA_ID=CAMNT_0051377207 /DNA_START=32 /DNA_END=220 /DNA_ORIENTATION=+